MAARSGIEFVYPIRFSYHHLVKAYMQGHVREGLYRVSFYGPWESV